MENLRTLHNEAMDLAQMAQISLQQGDENKARELFIEAFAKEQSVAMKAYELNHPQPGLSILLQSAAHLAVTCGKEREAEKLAGLALAGDVPEEIARDLRMLVSSLYVTKDDSYDVYQLHVPTSDSSIMSALNIMLQRLGCSIKKIHGASRKVSVL